MRSIRKSNLSLQEHLEKGCPVCSDGIKHAAASVTFLATMPEQLEPPARLRKRVLASIGIEKSNWGWIAAFAASMAALAVAIIWFSGENRRLDGALVAMRLQMDRTTAQLASAQAVLQFLNEPETKQVLFGQGRPQPPRGRVLLNSRRGVLLIASNLPPAPSGKTYELLGDPETGCAAARGTLSIQPARRCAVPSWRARGSKRRRRRRRHTGTGQRIKCSHHDAHIRCPINGLVEAPASLRPPQRCDTPRAW